MKSLYIKRTVQLILILSMIGCLKIEPVYLDWLNFSVIEFPLGAFTFILIFVLFIGSFWENN